MKKLKIEYDISDMQTFAKDHMGEEISEKQAQEMLSVFEGLLIDMSNMYPLLEEAFQYVKK